MARVNRRSDDRGPPPPPDATSLREAALSHLARFETTRSGLARVLARRIGRWSVRAAAAGEAPETIARVVHDATEAVEAVVSSLAASDAVDDTRFAVRQASADARAGRSSRASGMRLAAKGVATELARAASSRSSEAELEAAVAHARRRRLGPFARTPEDAAARLRALGSFARAGFDRATAGAALGMTVEEAELTLARLRQRE